MATLSQDSREAQKILYRLVAKAWLDETFKQRFVSETATVLEENGLTIPNGLQIKVNQNASAETLTSTVNSSTSNEIYEIPLPPKPAGLKDEQLRSWSDRNLDVEMIIPGTF